jgi:serine/threonine-protein kinase
LGDAFLLERELKGGMSRVFIAREKALGRTVVLKVLPPELSVSLSSERFRREIQVAANLQHPHIVPLLSAGQAGEFLYYTMPLVEGESLRERLVHGGELPVRIAVRILSEVARALAYAHRHGIVHRDIKPDNILLTGDDAQVADFGIAKAISASAQYGDLTSAGVALGTPMYMAPEQASADPTTDARADLYSLGVVAYEMLAGQPPFQGRTSAHLMAAHATERPVPVRERRRAVPVALGDMIMRLLEKRPADRPQSADELLSILEVSQAAADPGPTARVSAASALSAAFGSSAPNSQRRNWWIAGGVAALALVVVLVVAGLHNWEPAVKVNQDVVAVVPFRVTAADSSLAYLREGMVDLLAAKLSGVAGTRAADPRSLLAVWRAAARSGEDLPAGQAARVAERVGAGRMIQGDVVGTRQQITINATMLQTPTRSLVASATVEGSPDSLPRLVDRLAIKLLALQAGESEQRLANLVSTSLPALRAYLEGQALVRRGEYRSAANKFKLAIQEDSTFALAGLGLTRANTWFGGTFDGPGSLLAWKYRDKLSAPDRALLESYLGSRWPAPRQWRDGIAAAERFVQVAPDNPEAWSELADNLYHWGMVAGISDAHQRAAQAFARSFALDSSFAPALEHGPSLALTLGDTAGARRALALLMRIDSASATVASERWHLALATRDTATRRQIVESDSNYAPYMMSIGISAGLPLQDIEAIVEKNRARAVTVDEQGSLQRFTHNYFLITGRPSRGVPLPSTFPEPTRLAMQYTESRLADGDTTANPVIGPALERLIGMPLHADEPSAAVRFVAGQRALDRGRLELAQRAVADLRAASASPDSAARREIPIGFAILLEAELAAKQKSPELPRLLNQLDSALVSASSIPFILMGNLIASRLWEEQGDLPRALAAIRRRVWDLIPNPYYVTYHREEGRLAALNGDRQGAIRAYRRYLTIRANAEPRLQPQLRQVQSELDGLLRESTDKP